MSFSTLYRRWGLDKVKNIHAECGIEYNIYESVVTREVYEEVLEKLILEHNKYITVHDLAEYFKVTHSLIVLNKVDIKGINSKYGFHANWKGFEDKIFKYLSKYCPNISILPQKTFPDCKNPKTKGSQGRLKYDFFLPEYNMLIECDGPGHFDKACIFYSEEVLERDAYKTEYARSKGIFLLRIKYSKSYNESDFLKDMSETPLKLSVG